MSAVIDLFAEFITQHAATKDLLSKLIVRHTATSDMFSKLIVRHSATQDLKALFDVGQDSLDLKAVFICRHATDGNLLAKFILVNDAGTMSQGIPADVLEALGVIT